MEMHAFVVPSALVYIVARPTCGRTCKLTVVFLRANLQMAGWQAPVALWV